MEGNCSAHSGPGSLLSFQADPLPSKTPPQRPSILCSQDQCIWGHWSWGDRKEAEGRTGEAGGRGPPGPEEQEKRGGHFPHPLESRKPVWLPGEVPCPLRLWVGETPGPHLFLEPKPHPSQSPGPFPALWVLSKGTTHGPIFAFA